MRRLDKFLMRLARAVALPIALAATAVEDWLRPVLFEVGMDGRIHPRR